MLATISNRHFSKWLHQRLAKAKPSSTIGLIVDHSEVKNQELDCLSHLHKSQEFRQDLSLDKHYWFYAPSTGQRVLLLQQKLGKEAEIKDKIKDIKGLAKVAAAQL